MINILKIIIILNIVLTTQVCLADDNISCSTANYHNSARDWAISNAYHYNNIVLMQVGIGRVENWYNPFRFFNRINIYRYPAKVLEIYKSDNNRINDISYLEESREDNVIYSDALVGKRIIAFNNTDDCAYLDIAVFPEANTALINDTKKIIHEMRD